MCIRDRYQKVLFANRDPMKMHRDAVRVAQLSELVLAATEDLVAQLVAQSQGVPQ